MKIMKLGSKPDAFQGDGTNTRYMASELATDVIVNVGEVKFYLHKFPLLSKSNLLRRLIFKASEDATDEIYLRDCPGGSEAFEMCSKFCYGMVISLNAYNVAASRCAAEYLEMTEDAEKGNLIFKIEVFLNSIVFRSWKDSIIVLQTTKSLLPWSEELKVVERCIDSIASKAFIDPSNVQWSYTYRKKMTASNEIVGSQRKIQSIPNDWWVEDLCDLEIDQYKKVMLAVKSKGVVSSNVMEEALKAYAVRWLPDSLDILVSDAYMRRNRSLVETIIWLLPSDKYSGCSCSFLLKLLKIVVLVGAQDFLKEELMDRISVQLHKASVKDLLIPKAMPGDTVYDVLLVQSLIKRYMMQHTNSHNHDYAEKSGRIGEFVLGHSSLVALGKLVDGYLAKIGSDPNLLLNTFIGLSMSIPEAARPVHDGLYKAIDIYLKEHPNLMKEEKKSLSGLMDVRKLSTEACLHAMQNDGLPLRVVVRILFFQQLRSATPNKGTLYVGEDLEGQTPEHYNHLRKELKGVKIEDDYQNNEGKKSSKKNGKSGGEGLMLRSRSRRIFDKLWVGRGHGENKSTETSGSSQSPPASVNLSVVRSSYYPLRNRRHSIS